MYRHICLVSIVAIAVTLFGLLSACGGSDEDSSEWARQEGSLRKQLGLDRPFFAAAQPPSAPAPASAPTVVPAAPAPLVVEVVKEVMVEKEVTKAVDVQMSESQAVQGTSEVDSTQAQLVTQRRIIIREVDMSLVVDEIQDAIDKIAAIADDVGGWVVDSGRWALHSGSISIRVPADELDATIEDLRNLANKVEAENTTSRDVTDEYVDLGSRLKNQQATQQALLALLERATSVEAALAVQRDLSEVQEEVERLSGRIKFLEESAAFSIIRVNLSLGAVEVAVDAGPDLIVAVGAPVSARATFSPPDGIEDYVITWDFGDASEPQTVYRTAPTQKPGELTTATVNHIYSDTVGSPFIAQVSITGTGEGGIIKGQDTLTISVSEVPTIELFPGDYKDVTQNSEVSFSGSFTRPQGLTNVRFEWDFGDGSPPESGDLEEGVTRANSMHVYRDFRPEPFAARLTISADSEVGEIEVSGVVPVRIREQLGFVVGGYDFGSSLKSAVRGLSTFVQSLAVVLIWVVIFVPLWAIIAAVIWLAVRAVRWRRSRRNQVMPEQQAVADD